MAEGSVHQELPSRRACESCRRRKARCPAERPICSLCQRANQQCVYLPRDRSRQATRVDKATRRNPKDRVQNIESQINDIYTKLDSLTRSPLDTSAGLSVAAHDDAVSNGSDNVRATAVEHFATTSTQINCSSRTLKHAVDVYRTRIHLQPLPLFSLNSLFGRLNQCSPFLCWSFLGLCQHLSPQPLSTDEEPDAAQRHYQSAREAVGIVVFEGVAKLEVLQALCLLALIEMKVGEPARAWMTIGMASRLRDFRTSTRPTSDQAHEDEEHILRCYWSIYILEKAFAQQPEFHERTKTTPNYPRSASPPLSRLAKSGLHPVAASSRSEAVEDRGILASCFDLISVWGGIGSYLHEIRSGRAESPWLPTSIGNRLNLQTYEFEAGLSSRHLFRNVDFPGQPASDLLEHREYWSPWAFMQIAAHAVRAILNHPFLHLVTMHDSSRVPKPSAFLQQTVDIALYNTGWVARLLRIFENLPFEINDPLLGHMVAGTATVLWFFQFARDSKISLKAKEDLDRCERFLKRMSTTWPHIAQKLKLLQDLQARIQDSRNERNGDNITVSFRPSVIWALLDSNITCMAPNSPQSPLDSSTDSDDAASVCLTLHFVHPLVENQEAAIPTSISSIDNVFSNGNVAMDLFPDAPFFQSPYDTNQWLFDEL